MAVDYFLKIDGAGIKGESPVEGMKDYMQISSYSFGATQTGTYSYGSGGTGGKVSMQDFHFVMKHSKASPKILEACASAEHLKTVTLVGRKASGKAAIEFLKIEMKDCIVSSFQTGGQGSGDDIPMDQISVNFASIHHTYTEQKDDGSKGSNTEGKWSLKKEKATT